MSEEKVRKCPECGGLMWEGERLKINGGKVTQVKKGDFSSEKITPWYCRKCGFVKLYKMIKRRKLP
jgi:predicted nucleic-acid-binding Zn-ribbon protein